MKGLGLFPVVDFVIVFILEAQELTAVKKNHDKMVDRQQVMYRVKPDFQVLLPRHRGSICQLPFLSLTYAIEEQLPGVVHTVAGAASITRSLWEIFFIGEIRITRLQRVKCILLRIAQHA